jgi:hypothetical protein
MAVLVTGVVALGIRRMEEMGVRRCSEDRGGAGDFYSGKRVRRWSGIGRVVTRIVTN